LLVHLAGIKPALGGFNEDLHISRKDESNHLGHNPGLLRFESERERDVQNVLFLKFTLLGLNLFGM